MKLEGNTGNTVQQKFSAQPVKLEGNVVTSGTSGTLQQRVTGQPVKVDTPTSNGGLSTGRSNSAKTLKMEGSNQNASPKAAVPPVFAGVKRPEANATNAEANPSAPVDTASTNNQQPTKATKYTNQPLSRDVIPPGRSTPAPGVKFEQRAAPVKVPLFREEGISPQLNDSSYAPSATLRIPETAPLPTSQSVSDAQPPNRTPPKSSSARDMRTAEMTKQAKKKARKPKRVSSARASRERD